MGDVGRVAESLRLARRQRLPGLGLPHALPAAWARGDASGRRAVDPGAARRRDRHRLREPLLDRVPRPARRARLVRLRGLHAGCRAVGALPLAGDAAQASPAGRPARPGTVAAHARNADRADDRRCAAGPDGRDRRRARPLAPGQRGRRRIDGGDARCVDGLRALSPAPLRGRLARPPRRLPRPRRLRARDRRACRPTTDPLLVNLSLVGLSHVSTPVAVRERAFVPLDEAGQVARLLAAGGEAVCLSTCNRTELYVVGPDSQARSLEALARVSGLAEEELQGVYRLGDEAAALHLFRVAAGLDSMVPGEGEILGQVRDAYEAGAPGPILDRLFREALH